MNKQDFRRPAKIPAEAPVSALENENETAPRPDSDDWSYQGSGKLEGRTAIITGGDGGIGRSIAQFYAREGADVAIIYRNQDEDAWETKRLVESEGRRCLVLAGKVGDDVFCRTAVEATVRAFGKLDILVNNATDQNPRGDILDISEEQLEQNFRANLFGYFHMVEAALPHLRGQKGSVIINTSSRTANRSNEAQLDYSFTKSAIMAFTRSLSKSLAKEGIRVNGVAPGLDEVAPSYVFLASDDSSGITGQFIDPTGGEIVDA